MVARSCRTDTTGWGSGYGGSGMSIAEALAAVRNDGRGLDGCRLRLRGGWWCALSGGGGTGIGVWGGGSGEHTRTRLGQNTKHPVATAVTAPPTQQRERSTPEQPG